MLQRGMRSVIFVVLVIAVPMRRARRGVCRRMLTESQVPLKGQVGRRIENAQEECAQHDEQDERLLPRLRCRVHHGLPEEAYAASGTREGYQSPRMAPSAEQPERELNHALLPTPKAPLTTHLPSTRWNFSQRGNSRGRSGFAPCLAYAPRYPDPIP